MDVIRDAQSLAIKNANPEVTDMHLLYALISDGKSDVLKVITESAGEAIMFIDEIH